MNTSLEPARLDKAQEDDIHALEKELNCRIVALEPKSHYANLSHDQFVRLQGTEKELDLALVAYEPEVTFRVAKPPDEQLKRLQQLEKETGYILVAYQHVRQEPVESFRPREGYEPVILSEGQQERLERAEAGTGLVLMAYKKP